MKSRKKIPTKRLAVFVMLTVAAVIGVFWGFRHFKEEGPKELLQKEQIQSTLDKLQEDDIQGIFFAMYPLDSYNVDDILFYRGLNTVMLPQELANGREMADFLQAVLEQPHHLEAVYMGFGYEKEQGSFLDSIFQARKANWESQIRDLVQANPQIRFYIMLEYPSVNELAAFSEKETEELLDWYRELAALFTAGEDYSNIVLSMPGGEAWATGNISNYLEDGQPNLELAQFVLGQVVCNERYLLTTDNVEYKINALQDMIREYRDKQTADPEYTLVFFGDSVIGNYTDSMSIPEVVRGFTGARVFNCGYGGLSAARTDEYIGIADIVDAFLAGDESVIIEEGKPVKEGIIRFHELAADIKQEKLVFLLSLGLNDYLSSLALSGGEMADTYTFKGALEYAVTRLKEAYPNSEIILMTPNFLGLCQNGTEVHDGHVFEDYVNTVISVSEEQQVKCIDVYREANINAVNKNVYLADECHPNEYGKYEIGKLVGEYIARWYPAE